MDCFSHLIASGCLILAGCCWLGFGIILGCWYNFLEWFLGFLIFLGFFGGFAQVVVLGVGDFSNLIGVAKGL